MDAYRWNAGSGDLLLDIFTAAGDLWTKILLGTLCAALACLDPAPGRLMPRLFGWKRIDVRDRD